MTGAPTISPELWKLLPRYPDDCKIRIIADATALNVSRRERGLYVAIRVCVSK